MGTVGKLLSKSFKSVGASYGAAWGFLWETLGYSCRNCWGSLSESLGYPVEFAGESFGNRWKLPICPAWRFPWESSRSSLGIPVGAVLGLQDKQLGDSSRSSLGILAGADWRFQQEQLRVGVGADSSRISMGIPVVVAWGLQEEQLGDSSMEIPVICREFRNSCELPMGIRLVCFCWLTQHLLWSSRVCIRL